MHGKDKRPQCALCPYDWNERFCRKEGGPAPGNCPSLRHRDFADQSLEEMQSTANFEFARQASIQESEGYGGKDKEYGSVYPIKPRILEIVEFAKRMGYERLGLIFCVGLRKEAAVAHKLFEARGLEVISIVCKVGRIPKEALGLSQDQKMVPGSFESMCNPILQAGLANHYESQFNVLLGLCVGHDSLFFKYAEAPCTVLAVKDRLLGHNPLAALYQCESYYRYLMEPDGQSTPP
jgi:uncharacterized metal-binding protein